MKFNFPLQVPPDRVLTLTQPFGKTDNTLEPGGPNGEPHFHYGVDVVDGLAAETYGTPVVCPFPSATLESYQFPGTDGKVTPFSKLVHVADDGTKYEMISAHISAIFFHDTYAEGTVLAFIGNTGVVSPKPTITEPFAGSHIHLGLQVNGEWTDPLKYFDIGSPFRGPEHSPENNVPRLSWAFDILKAKFAEILKARGL